MLFIAHACQPYLLKLVHAGITVHAQNKMLFYAHTNDTGYMYVF